MEARPYSINTEDLVKTMAHLRENHEPYRLVYRLMPKDVAQLLILVIHDVVDELVGESPCLRGTPRRGSCSTSKS